MKQFAWITASAAAMFGWSWSTAVAVDCDVLCGCVATMQAGGCPTLPTGIDAAGISFFSYPPLSHPGCCDFAPWGCTSQKCQAQGLAYIRQAQPGGLDLWIEHGANGYASGNGTRLSTTVVHEGECGTTTTVTFSSGTSGVKTEFCSLWIGCGDC